MDCKNIIEIHSFPGFIKLYIKREKNEYNWGQVWARVIESTYLKSD